MTSVSSNHRVVRLSLCTYVAGRELVQQQEREKSGVFRGVGIRDERAAAVSRVFLPGQFFGDAWCLCHGFSFVFFGVRFATVS